MSGGRSIRRKPSCMGFLKGGHKPPFKNRTSQKKNTQTRKFCVLEFLSKGKDQDLEAGAGSASAAFGVSSPLCLQFSHAQNV